MWYIFGCFQRVGVDEFDYYRVEMIFQVMMSQKKKINENFINKFFKEFYRNEF